MSKRNHQTRLLRLQQSRRRMQMFGEKPIFNTHREMIQLDLARREPQQYTGTLVRGIATMHKSNAVPVISDQQAVDISRMAK